MILSSDMYTEFTLTVVTAQESSATRNAPRNTAISTTDCARIFRNAILTEIDEHTARQNKQKKRKKNSLLRNFLIVGCKRFNFVPLLEFTGRHYGTRNGTQKKETSRSALLRKLIFQGRVKGHPLSLHDRGWMRHTWLSPLIVSLSPSIITYRSQNNRTTFSRQVLIVSPCMYIDKNNNSSYDWWNNSIHSNMNTIYTVSSVNGCSVVNKFLFYIVQLHAWQ